MQVAEWKLAKISWFLHSYFKFLLHLCDCDVDWIKGFCNSLLHSMMILHQYARAMDVCEQLKDFFLLSAFFSSMHVFREEYSGCRKHSNHRKKRSFPSSAAYIFPKVYNRKADDVQLIITHYSFLINKNDFLQWPKLHEKLLFFNFHCS